MTDVRPGHIKISRKAFDPDLGDPFWHEKRVFSRWEAWVYLIQLAAFSSRRYQTHYGPVDLERGEFVVSLRKLAVDFMWSFKSVRNYMATLQKGARLGAQRETQAGMVYLIVNYDTYQSGGNVEGTAKGTAKGTGGAQGGHKREAGKAGKAEQTTIAAGSDAVATVLEHFTTLHPKRRPGDKDRKIVARALGLGYAASELCEAITGNANDEWCKNISKHELAYVLRDNGQIDTFRAKGSETLEDLWDYDRECLTALGERLTRPAA